MSNFKLTFLLLLFAAQTKAQTINISGPAGSGQFGKTVTVLPNGNYVVTDPSYDEGSIVNVGAVYLYNGATHTIISVLKGSQAEDSIGNGGITELTNGNFVIISPRWDNGAAINAGATTWCSSITGTSGVLNSSNSLVGNSASTNSNIGIEVIKLSNGNYVVVNPYWDNGVIQDEGAVTLGNGYTGVSGTISSSNSLVGSKSGDRVGLTYTNYPYGYVIGITVLTNDNYVVFSSFWDNGSINDAGAASWGNGTTGISGIVNSSNSLIGSSTGDNIGNGRVIALTNGNYVVASPNWDNASKQNVGAATWGNGTIGVSGTINSSNSLVGSTGGDNIGYMGVTALPNGNYVVNSPNWHNGAAGDAGAATWGNGATGTSGFVNSSNSLVGSQYLDRVGHGTINLGNGTIALSNGNYVVSSPNWKNGIANGAGAATWGNGTTGTTGTVSSSNSLVGSTTSDNVGNEIIALANGNYIVKSPSWDNDTLPNAGAVTWGNGTAGVAGFVSSNNSLIGTRKFETLGNFLTILANGNYVVSNPNWRNGTLLEAGASTWGNGSTGTSGFVDSSNSLIGNISYNHVGAGAVALTNGNYIVLSPGWNNGVGAVTLANENTGISGVVSSSNSLIGSTIQDNFGSGATALANGSYVIRSGFANVGAFTWFDGSISTSGVINISTLNSLVGMGSYSYGMKTIALGGNKYMMIFPYLNYGAVNNAGAVTLSNGFTGITGLITSCNSVMATAPSGGISLFPVYNNTYDCLIVGRPKENIVSIFATSNMILANTLDSVSVNINELSPMSLISNTGCQIIATLTPGGANPVSGTINAKVWIEPSVPTYGEDPFVARQYIIAPVINVTTATGKVTLYFTQQEFDDFNSHPGSVLDLPTGEADAVGKSNLRVSKYYGLPVVIDPNDDDIIWNASLNRWEVSFGVIGFGRFVVQTKLTALPLQLLNFYATLTQNDVSLTWKTTNETNMHSFDVERSTDGRSFTKVGTVAAINSTIDQTYNYIDAGAGLLNASKLYYRLKIVEKNGSYSNSLIVLLHLSKNNSVTVYPNPVTNITTLSFGNKALINTTAVITDMLGKQLRQFIISNYQQQINMSHFANGVYILKLEDGTAIKIVKS